MIELDRVSVELGGRRVADGVSLEVGAGEWVALLGPNGAGKTTLLRAVARLGRRELAQRLALVPQTPRLPPGMTVSEYVLLGRSPYVSYLGSESRRDLDAAQDALARLDLVRFARRELGSLSGGEQQRATLARALAQGASVLLLDEPTASLDAGRQQQALELVDELRLEKGLTVLGAMHDLTLAGQYAQRVVLMSEGRVVAAGAPEEVLTEAAIGTHYGASVRIVEGAVIPVRR